MQSPYLPTQLMGAKYAGRILIIIALLTACALRFWLLDSKSYWLDEAWTTRIVERGQVDFWNAQTEQFHPPLFFGLLELWTRLGQEAYFWRAPSALFGILTVAFVYSLADVAVGRAAAVTTVWFAALSPWLIWYSQELRMYSLFACLFTLGALAIVKYLTRPQFVWWLAAMMAVAAALYTHYAAVLMLPVYASLGIAYLVYGRVTPRTVWLAVLTWPTALLVYWPWLLSPAAQRFLREAGNHPIWGRLFSQIFNRQLMLLPLLLFGVIGMAVGLYIFYRLLRHWRGRHPDLHATPWVRVVVLVLFCLVLALSVIPRGSTFKRQLLIFWPLVLPFFGWVWPWEWVNRRILGTLLGLSLVAAVITVYAVPKDQWRETTAYILEHRQPGDLVLLLPAHMRMPFDVYVEHKTKYIGQLPAQLYPRLPGLAHDYSRIWLVEYPRDMRAEDYAIEDWLQQNVTLKDTKKFYRIDVKLFDTQE